MIALAGGGLHSLARLDDGSAWGWGEDANGQVGIPIPTPSTVLEAAAIDLGGVRVRALGAGGYHTLAVQADNDPTDPGASYGGLAWAWGGHDRGQLGIGPPLVGAQPQPTRVLGPNGVGTLRGIKAVAGGWNHSLAVVGTGETFSWGDGTSGKLGTGATIAYSDVPLPQSRTPDPLPGDQGNHLLAAKFDPLVGPDVYLAWPGFEQPPGTPTPNEWDVCRNVLKTQLEDCVSASPRDYWRSTPPSCTDQDAVTLPPDLQFYRIHGLSQCYQDRGP